MNKYIICQFLVVLVSFVVMVSCTDERGTEPGNDPNPVVLMYQLDVTAPYDLYDDAKVRFVSNNKTEAAYYYAGKEVEIESLKASMGEEGFMNYVVSNGTLLTEIYGESYQEVYIKDLVGDCLIEAVAVGNGKMHRSETDFHGKEFVDLAKGKYHNATIFAYASLIPYWNGPEYYDTVLQYCPDDDSVYRLYNVFGEGHSLYIDMINQYGTKTSSSYGPTEKNNIGVAYQYGRVQPTFVNVYYEYYGGDVYFRDLGYYWGNDSYITSRGYECRVFENNNVEVCVSYYTNTYRSGIAWGWDSFTADE